MLVAYLRPSRRKICFRETLLGGLSSFLIATPRLGRDRVFLPAFGFAYLRERFPDDLFAGRAPFFTVALLQFFEVARINLLFPYAQRKTNAQMGR